ncbi:hypothetical protein A2V56_03835 [Candidatus Woesebacteria bacterium RBG_19FT_COMBO_42_9]|uniref:Transglutaminase-like domain-containing protein n=1 Tax=Candidatus Woesebacteria bacterium RBG_16_42_24 TaxID=1802485 RepID=A0A1F7XM84_9BACT|nr:MAG: hypothetical protein A2V97_00405 [Candidatus Woesebacteria bacterium RBG_16_42_24]OGM17595.1 MAG: hypothetical protein A2V56_03835 [Candidatus Woesebacteria bacterium RBG_19FT_COMBO_42_9]OGM67104.1 MAG: hypothetical protein A2985_02520 [Candidatus Woesebacteria bacterium RIFCSPLOWO2_01_FULL_43_11]
MIKKIFFSFLFFITFLFLKTSPALAEEDFLVDSQVSYEVQESGTTIVSHNITLENQVSDLYATSYSLELNNIDPKNIKAYQGDHFFQVEESQGENTVTLKVNFEDALVGKGKIRDFFITFEEEAFASRTGEIWEISIPRLSQESTFRNYSLVLSVPLGLGEEAYISPEPESSSISNNRRLYSYSKKSSQELGITAGFGNFQVFSFTLNYHLENPLNKQSEIEIAIPPDTAYQKLYYEVVEPRPKNIRIDSDGNWLAIYELSNRQRIDVRVSGSVQIFAGPRPYLNYPKEVLEGNLKETEFWQTSDPVVTSLSQRLKTPFEIYEFVSKNLTYDFERVAPETKRLGAKDALNNPDSAICMEYTDSFIAIARAAGIPAREINGYAYTENPEIQPLSLVSDVLHSWPEYWDYDKAVWIPIDPTWASTTGGIDYFNKLDLRHFTFVIHGMDAVRPFPPGSYKLGPNPQKDVFVNFGQLPAKKVSVPEILATLTKSPGLFGKKVKVSIKNPGPVALYNTNSEVIFDQSLAQKNEIDILPPYATYEFEAFIPFGILGSKAPEKVVILTLGQRVELPTNKGQVVLYNLALLLIILMALLTIFILRLKRINPFSYLAKVYYSAKLKINEKFKKNKNNTQGF